MASELSVLSPEKRSTLYIADGFAHPALAQGVAEKLGVALGGVHHDTFPNSELYARPTNSVRGKNVFIIQPHVPTEHGSVSDAIMEQQLLADAARSSGAISITAVSPYLGYTRQDRKSKGREPIGVRVVIDSLVSSGVTSFMVVDMHSAQSEAVFRGPFNNLTMQPSLRNAMQREDLVHHDKEKLLVVAPDAGAAKMAERHAEEMDAEMILMPKTRKGSVITRPTKLPEADGRVCMIFDDMIDTGTTLAGAVEILKDGGAEAVYVAASHPVFSGKALTVLGDAPIDRLYVADTHPTDHAQDAFGERLHVVASAPLIGQAIVEIIMDGSVSSVFNAENYM